MTTADQLKIAVQSTVSISQRGTRAPASNVHSTFFTAAPLRRTKQEQEAH
jgi:hypothetical protein